MSLKHAILAMLDIEEGSGYDLVKRFNKSIGYFWSSSYQQVYRDLKALEDLSLISSKEIIQVGKPDKKLLRITDPGLDELKNWLEKPSKPMKVKEPLLVKLFAGRLLKKEVLLVEIDRHKQHHQETLEKYLRLTEELKQMEEPRKTRYQFPYQTLQLGIHIEKAWLDWAEETSKNIQLMDDLDD